jgi:hypothetical protein
MLICAFVDDIGGSRPSRRSLFAVGGVSYEIDHPRKISNSSSLLSVISSKGLEKSRGVGETATVPTLAAAQLGAMRSPVSKIPELPVRVMPSKLTPDKLTRWPHLPRGTYATAQPS